MGLFDKSKKSETRTCNFTNLSECPYASVDECKFNKKNCFRKKKAPIFTITTLKILVVILIGLLIALVSIYLDAKVKFTGSHLVFGALSSIAVSLIAGAVLAWMIDIPSKLKEYENSIVNALVSNNYLKSLDEERLTQLRKDVTEQLHKVNVPCMARGLIDIDQKICNLLKQPYYTRYRQTVVCKKDEENGVIVKHHTIDYKLINPYSVNSKATEYISIANLVLSNGKDNMKDKAITDVRIRCIIDDGQAQNLSSEIEFDSSSVDSRETFYDTKVELVAKKDSYKGDKKGLKIEFDKSLEVKMSYDIVVDKDDISFTKRLRHPAKNFRLDYTFETTSPIKIFGQLFGTELKQSDFLIRYPLPNSVSLESFEWLLPDNGAIVVTYI
ncbi:hypothetical protein V7T14_14835 [Segatella copri]|uniref:hypothetical protein n=1 Tax=Segatella copri TaxID=165179 RepID=UPI001C447B98|nr:hypothetical protein [Segatella copri]MBW0032578.1 hypothetical protein [Segatella copri]